MSSVVIQSRGLKNEVRVELFAPTPMDVERAYHEAEIQHNLRVYLMIRDMGRSLDFSKCQDDFENHMSLLLPALKSRFGYPKKHIQIISYEKNPVEVK